MCRPQLITIENVGRFALLIATLAFVVRPSTACAFDPAAPAQLRMLVRDDDGNPLPGVDVNVRESEDLFGDRVTSHAVTDAAGTATLNVARPCPRRGLTWTAEVELSKPGRICDLQRMHFFPGAVFDKESTLRQERRTLIRLRGPSDEPLSGARFYLAADGVMDMSARTDARGEYLCVHPPWPEGFGVGFEWGEWPHYDDAPTVTIRYAAGELPHTLPPRQVALRVLADDGAPAAGWFLIPDAVHWGTIGSAGSIDAQSILHYRCRGVQHLDSQGVANLLLVNDLLLVMSPAGALFRFRLNPAAWGDSADKVHRLTLRVPPLRERHAGRLVWQDGNPIGGVPLVVERTGRTETSWQDSARGGQFNAQPLWQATADDGARIKPLRTDADGRYELPFYFGGQSHFGMVTHDYWPEGLEGRQQVVLKRPAVGSVDYRDIVIAFRDEFGQPVDKVELASFKAYCGKRVIINYAGDYRIFDRRGRHAIVPAEVDRLELETNSAAWQPHREEFSVPAGDAELVVVLAESTRRHVLSGVVLDPDGRPVADVTVSKLHPVAERSHHGTPYSGGRATTDVRGRFSFDQPPQRDEPTIGQMSVFRSGRFGKEDPLPGWTDEVPYTADSHELTIRLKPGGAVRALLPAGERNGFRVSIAGLPPLDGPLTYRRLQYDAATHSMLATQVRPGQYKLWVQRGNSAEQAAEADAAPRASIEVALERETTIDLSQETPPEPAPRPDLPTAVTVEQGGEPVQGAQVLVFLLPQFDDRLLSDLASDRAAVRMRAIEQFGRTGISGLAPLRKLLTSDDADLRASGRSIERSLEQYFSDGLEEAGADTSGDGGRAWFLALPGRRYIAVARLPGRSIGYRSFEADSQGRPRIEMHRSRSLMMRVSMEENYDPALSLRLPGAEVNQPAALCRLWLDLPAYVTTRYQNGGLELPLAPIVRDLAGARMTYLVEDLPIGTRCELHLTGSDRQSIRKEVTIDDEPVAMQTVYLVLPRAPRP